MASRRYKNLIAIEGGDGSGKGTQTELLRTYIEEELKLNALKISFPRYGNSSARYAGRYLDGQYGTADDVHPDLGVLPFALDRFAAKDEIDIALSQPNTFGVLDRYMASNLAHQGAKIDDKEQRHRFYDETLNLEYELLGIPRPAKNIVLLVPADVAQLNVDKKDAATRSYTNKKRDIHEADASHLEKAKRNYEELCELYPDEFTAIECMDDNGSLRSIDDIQAEIRQLLSV
jgi:dTMP kinase